MNKPRVTDAPIGHVWCRNSQTISPEQLAQKLNSTEEVSEEDSDMIQVRREDLNEAASLLETAKDYYPLVSEKDSVISLIIRLTRDLD